jgi:hypothetical protein
MGHLLESLENWSSPLVTGAWVLVVQTADQHSNFHLPGNWTQKPIFCAKMSENFLVRLLGLKSAKHVNSHHSTNCLLSTSTIHHNPTPEQQLVCPTPSMLSTLIIFAAPLHLKIVLQHLFSVTIWKQNPFALLLSFLHRKYLTNTSLCLPAS